MSPRKLHVALNQARPSLREPEVNVSALEHSLSANPGIDLMVCPELFISGYTTRAVEELALAKDDNLVARLAATAGHHDTALIVGLAERFENRVANSVLCINRSGHVFDCYRKAQLFGAESQAFTPGDALRIVNLDGVRVGLMICFDIEFPEIARALALAGADMLVSVSANMTPFGPDHLLFVQTRALENRLPHVYVNQVGRGEEFLFTGDSCYANDSGAIAVQCPPHTEALQLIEVALGNTKRIRPDYLKLRLTSMPPVVSD